MNALYLMSSVIISFALLFSTQPLGAAPKPKNPPPAKVPARSATTQGLTESEAAFRGQRVKNVKYLLAFSLDESQPDFKVTETIFFDLEKPQLAFGSKPLTVDFEGGVVDAVSVNGKKIRPIYNKIFLTLSTRDLREGRNKVDITARHPYSSSGSGLYRFKDPEDSKVYLYSDFEPFDANKMFPSFDQPDLKATYLISAEVPAAWTVVSSTRESKIEDVAGSRKRWTFPESAKFSTYLVELAAGPYRVWEDKVGDVPLRLFARESMAKYVDPTDWFTITKQGLEFFGSYFGVSYPFLKYDQIIVPDFNAGAMENVAAVTFSERFLPRGAPTRSQRESRANVILHEMAHMWFGNLVTMKWWNDLWLNESFATYMASLALVQATEFKEAWVSFHDGSKLGAYVEDQLSTTHPIETPVKDTETAFSNFDAITYGKGASALKQLQYFLGDKEFQNGVALYFKRHAYANATLADFMGALSETSAQDLSTWTNQWLRTSGVNTVEVKHSCEKGFLTKFQIEQTATNGVLRAHKTQVGLYRIDLAGNLVLDKAVPVVLSGSSTDVTSLIGAACPVFVNPNEGDYAYVKIKLDETSIKASSTHLKAVKDTLTRLMTWATLWESVRDGNLGVMVFLDLVLTHSLDESDLRIATRVANFVHGRYRTVPSAMSYLPASANGAEGDIQRSYGKKLEDFYLHRFGAAEAGSDLQKLAYDALARVASTPTGLDRLADMLAGKSIPRGFVLDQDRRWMGILRLSERDIGDALLLAHAEVKRDPSSTGQQMLLASRALKPDLSTKRSLLAEVVNNRQKRSLSQMRFIMHHLLPLEQHQERAALAESIYEILPEIGKSHEPEFSTTFARSLLPTYCTGKSVQNLRQFLAKSKSLSPSISKSLRIGLDEDERCVKVQSKVIGP